MKRIWIVWCWLVMVAAAGAAPPGRDREEMQEITAEQMDQTLMTPLAKRLLPAPEFKWRHAQTEHFVVHYENGIFAAKVARMAEFFYTYISADLQGASDRMKARSHIYIFRNEKDWRTFQRVYWERALEWSFSMVQGPVMYLQQADNLSSSAEVLGHEMTHLVLNRFFTGEIPVWLNEGMAEWYGEFAYAAFKGIKKSKRAQFQGLRSTIPVLQLMGLSSYPADPESVRLFYDTSKHVVGFLQLERPPEKFVPFVNKMMEGGDAGAALVDIYGFSSAADFASQFDKFRR